jgi:16S rRNA (guanine527-N7)-methyltransferase
MSPPEQPIDVAALRQGVAALGLTPDESQVRQLLDFAALLQRWNATYNLTAVRDPQGILTQHLLDCLAVVAPFRARLPPGAQVLDVGSGGGLPGVVLAVMLEDVQVTCIDAVGKKAAFVRQVAGALQLRHLHAVHGRVEALREGGFDLITSRAFASLSDFTRLTSPLLSTSGLWAAMKAHQPVDEAQALPPTVEMFHVERLKVPGLEAERCLVWMRPRSAT